MKKRYRNMKKKANGRVREIGEGGVLMELPMPVADVINSMPDVIRELSREAGLLLMSAAMQSECEKIAGPKHSKSLSRRANWWGSDLSPVYYDRQKVLIERPRLRGKDNKEIPLATYKALKNQKGMRGTVLKNMVLGISSRNYEETVEGLARLGTSADVAFVSYRSDQPFDDLEEACDFWQEYLGITGADARGILREFLGKRLVREGSGLIAPYPKQAAVIWWRVGPAARAELSCS